MEVASLGNEDEPTLDTQLSAGSLFTFSTWPETHIGSILSKLE